MLRAPTIVSIVSGQQAEVVVSTAPIGSVRAPSSPATARRRSPTPRSRSSTSRAATSSARPRPTPRVATASTTWRPASVGSASRPSRRRDGHRLGRRGVRDFGRDAHPRPHAGHLGREGARRRCGRGDPIAGASTYASRTDSAGNVDSTVGVDVRRGRPVRRPRGAARRIRPPRAGRLRPHRTGGRAPRRRGAAVLADVQLPGHGAVQCVVKDASGLAHVRRSRCARSGRSSTLGLGGRGRDLHLREGSPRLLPRAGPGGERPHPHGPLPARKRRRNGFDRRPGFPPPAPSPGPSTSTAG